MKINLNYGALSAPLEEQANEQGFTLGEKYVILQYTHTVQLIIARTAVQEWTVM